MTPKKIHRRRDADPEEGREKYGDTTFADPVNKKYAIDSPGRIKAAWAYIIQQPTPALDSPRPGLQDRKLPSIRAHPAKAGAAKPQVLATPPLPGEERTRPH